MIISITVTCDACDKEAPKEKFKLIKGELLCEECRKRKGILIKS